MHTGGNAAVCGSRLCAFLSLGWMLLPALFPVVLLAQADSSWREVTAPARLVFVRPAAQERFCLLTAPAQLAAGNVSGARAWSGDSVRPVRLVWADATNAFFLVDCRGVPERQEVALYLLPRADPQKPEAVISDPLPVRFYTQRTAGQDLPETWEQLQLLDTRVDRDPFYQDLPDFDAGDDSPTGWYRGDWQRKNHLFQLSSWVLFPATGRYVFGVKSAAPLWLTVDGERLLEHGASQRTAWAATRPREIAAGVHRVVVRGVSRRDLDVAAGWTLEGAKDAPGVVMVTGGEKVRARLERRDSRLHAFAVATPGTPYAFEGSPQVFVPVRLESRSVSLDGSPLACVWRARGREIGTGQACTVARCATSGVDCVELTVTDNRGNTAQDSVPMKLDGLARTRYHVSGRLVGVPAVGYGEDPVRPEIHVRATSPDKIDFTVEATIVRAGGSITNVTAVVDVVRSWGRLVLPADTADAFSRIDWRVLHGGEVVDRGSLVFDREPFRNWPDALDGDRLCTRSHALMLVARRASAAAAPPFEGMRPGQRLLLLDGFLALAGAADTNLSARLDRVLADGLDGAEEGPPSPDALARYQRVSLLALEANGSADGLARLMPLVQAGSFLPADVVVIAPSFDALGQGETLAQFERRLAALAGLFTGPGHATVMLVTPPPFAILPGCEGVTADGTCPPDARQLAEIICRVADAHGLPVADLYTSFMTATERVPLVRSGALTPAGMEQAAEALQRVLFRR
jgi:hypothetical protein